MSAIERVKQPRAGFTGLTYDLKLRDADALRLWLVIFRRLAVDDEDRRRLLEPLGIFAGQPDLAERYLASLAGGVSRHLETVAAEQGVDDGDRRPAMIETEDVAIRGEGNGAAFDDVIRVNVRTLAEAQVWAGLGYGITRDWVDTFGGDAATSRRVYDALRAIFAATQDFLGKDVLRAPWVPDR